MNRHIIGFTLFLVIVKTTLLIYWTFFAPLNVFTPPLETKNLLPVENSKSNKFKRPVLESVVIAPKQGKITAGAYVCTDKGELPPASNKLYLSVFSEDSRLVWHGALPQKELYGCKGADSETLSLQLKKINVRNNYYAQIDELTSDAPQSNNLVYEIHQIIPVLVNAGE